MLTIIYYIASYFQLQRCCHRPGYSSSGEGESGQLGETEANDRLASSLLGLLLCHLGDRILFLLSAGSVARPVDLLHSSLHLPGLVSRAGLIFHNNNNNNFI